MTRPSEIPAKLREKQLGPGPAKSLLDAVQAKRQGLAPRAFADAIQGGRTRLLELRREIMALAQLYSDVEQLEEDDQVRAWLGPYGQTFGAIDRELGNANEALNKATTWLRQLEDVEARIGEPLRTPPTGT